MPTNPVLGKPIVNFLLALAEINDYCTYTDAANAFFRAQFKTNPESTEDIEKRNKIRNGFYKARGDLIAVQDETKRSYLLEDPADKPSVKIRARLLKVHDDAPIQKRSCIILLEVRLSMMGGGVVRRGVFEKNVYEKYKRISEVDGGREWTLKIVKDTMNIACEKSHLKLEAGKYVPEARLSCDFDLIKGVVKSYRDNLQDFELKKQLTELLDNV